MTKNPIIQNLVKSILKAQIKRSIKVKTYYKLIFDKYEKTDSYDIKNKLIKVSAKEFFYYLGNAVRHISADDRKLIIHMMNSIQCPYRSVAKTHYFIGLKIKS